MENASEALIMAGQMLIFIIALTVCISSFTTLRTGIDETVGTTDVLEIAKGSSEEYVNFIESKQKGSTRVVGAETVISSMDRAIKENYVIYLKLKESTMDSIKNTMSDDITISKAQKDVKIRINGIDKTIILKDDDIIKITIGTGTNQKINNMLDKGLYDFLSDSKFNEYLGEYQDASAEGVSTENKQTYRIITYVETEV